MSKTKAILLVIALLILVGGVWLWTSRNASPPPRDFHAEYKALEARLARGDHDPQLWADFLQLAEDHADWAASYTPTVGASGKQIDMEWAYDPETDQYDVEGSLQMLRDYASGTTPPRLAALLSDPRLTPPSLVGDAPLHVMEVDTGIGVDARALALAEGARLRHFLRTGSAQEAAQCVAHIDRLARLLEARPTLIGLLLSISLDSLISGIVDDALRENALSAEAAQLFMDELSRREDHRLERAVMAFDGERILALSTLHQMYQGDPSGMYRISGSRRLLMESHAQGAERIERHYDDAIAHMKGGDAHAKYPDDDTAQSFIGRHLNSSLARVMLPSSDILRAIYIDECRRGMMMLALALRVYEEKHSEMPERLDDLVEAGVLEELPSNPFGTGGTFEYARDDSAPLGYTLDGSIPEDDE